MVVRVVFGGYGHHRMLVGSPPEENAIPCSHTFSFAPPYQAQYEPPVQQGEEEEEKEKQLLGEEDELLAHEPPLGEDAN